MLKTQAEIEDMMVGAGVARSRAAFEQAEQGGHADQNPYAAEVYRLFVEPLAALIDEAKASKGAARLQAHVPLLQPLDSWAVAYLAVRTCLTSVLAWTSGDRKANSRNLATAIGKIIHSELYLAQFQELSPDLYFILSEDLGRRKSKDVAYRIAVFKDQARKAGMNIVEWGVGSRDQIGLWMIDHLIKLDMIVMDTPPPGPGKRQPLGIFLTDSVQTLIEGTKDFFEMTRPAYGPCVEQPQDWTSWDNGGFHTRQMKRSMPYCVKAPQACRARLRDFPIPKVLQCINALQRTRWAINTEIMEVARLVAAHTPGGELVSDTEADKPTVPAFLATLGKEDDRTEEQELEFLDWKAQAKAWYTNRRLQRAARGRMYMALRTANEFAEYPAIHFVYFADSRGRIYPMTQGISPQGSDLQKALLKFADGKPLSTPAAVWWFLIQGANKWGFDKAALQDRADWHKDKIESILDMADNPQDNRQWMEADKPLQFLAWCFEFARWHRDPGTFVSHLPIGLDGSCSGLQHFSAMLRDEIGGKATNLTNSVVMQDIYQYVADAATKRMQADVPDAEGYRALWLKEGITRKVTKRSVMTTPYGVTKRSAVKYVIEDYLKSNRAFDKKDNYGQAHYLMNYVWPAIGDVVVKGREAMSWLTNAAKVIVKLHTPEDEGVISWVTPSGFLASQAYYDIEEHRVATKLYGHARIKVVTENDETSAARHATAMAPNFVHSMDASHLHLTVCALEEQVPNVSLAFIHDDFGVHAHDCQALYDILRQEFVAMYRDNDPLKDFMTRHPGVVPPPAHGNLNLNDVLESPFFFS